MTSCGRALLQDYAAHHRRAGNRACHGLGIPLIVLSLLGILARLPLARPAGVEVDLSHILLAAATLFYLALDLRLALAMLASGLALRFVGSRLGLAPLAALQAAGWGLQLAGHALFERRRPAFARNLAHLLVGPAWMAGRLVEAVAARRAEPRA